MLSFKSFIDEDYKTTTAKFVASGVDKKQVDVYINKFKELYLSNKQKLAGEEKKIDTWAKKTFLDFKNFVDVKEKEVADVAKKKAEKKDPGESIDITSPQQRSAGWNILIPLDKKASVFYGNLDCMSDWCVSKTKHEFFDKHFYDDNSNLIFCLNNKKEKWAIEIKSDGSTIIWDIKNNIISKSKFEIQTKLKFTDIFRSYEPFVEKIKAVKKKLNLAYTLKDLTHPDKEIEQRIINSGNAEYAYDYAYRILKGPFKAAEAVIATNADYAYDYALNVLEGPFKAGEALILKDAGSAFGYALYVLKGPFPTGEKVIAKDPYFAYAYALEVLKGPFKAGEAVIAKDWMWRRPYAVNVLKGPFILNGKTIVK